MSKTIAMECSCCGNRNAQSFKPRKNGYVCGCCGVAFLALLFLFIRALCYGDPVAGWPSMACLIVFFGGLQLFVVGILGAYLAKTYLEAKKRPMYLVKEEK